MPCEMCGSEGPLFKAVIEGSELNVCKNCGGFGKILRVIREERKEILPVKKQVTSVSENETIELIVSNYAEIIKRKREAIDLKQEDLAKKIGERTSVIHFLETGKHEPSIALAKKLEKFLKIKLVESHKEVKGAADSKKSSEGLTIGDLIKERK